MLPVAITTDPCTTTDWGLFFSPSVLCQDADSFTALAPGGSVHETEVEAESPQPTFSWPEPTLNGTVTATVCVTNSLKATRKLICSGGVTGGGALGRLTRMTLKESARNEIATMHSARIGPGNPAALTDSLFRMARYATSPSTTVIRARSENGSVTAFTSPGSA